MAVQTFPQFLVIDEQGNAAAGATVQAFNLIDTSFTTPLTVTDLNGLPLTLVSNTRGMVQAHRVDAASGVVVYRSGSMPAQPILSLDSVVQAADSAADSASAAGMLAAGVVRFVDGNAPDAEGRVVSSGGGGGGGGGVSDHGALGGLADDDHPQYLTEARSNNLHYTKAQVDTLANNAASASSSADRNRANHSGTQAISTVAGLQPILDSLGGAAVNSVAGKIGNVTLVAADISDAGSVGRTVMGATSEAAARTAIGASPTSHTHTASQVTDSTSTGRSILTASSSAAVLALIGAGTSNLELGTTASTALRGNAVQVNPASIVGLPVGTLIARTA